MDIDIVDMDDPVLGGNRKQWLDYLKATSTVVEMYGMSNGVEQMVLEVGRAARPASIDALRIWSHGFPGGQNVTAGASGSGTGDRAAISTGNLAALAGVLGRLRRYFKRTGRLELRGCNVGHGAAGEQLLVGLAKIVRVPVQAGTIVQQTGNWDGPVIQAFSNGAMTSTLGTPVGPGP